MQDGLVIAVLYSAKKLFTSRIKTLTSILVSEVLRDEDESLYDDSA
jgi:hypothetical protein